VPADVKGFATVYFYTADEAGVTSTITASATQNSYVADAQFTATATAPPSSITKVSGDAQTLAVNGLSPRALEVLVTDVNGQPMVDAPILFSVASGAGALY
jgi:hypothetical protein